MKLPRLLAQLAIAGGLGIFFAITGPFGTYRELGTAARYAYWVGLVLVGHFNMVLCMHALARFWPGCAPGWRIGLVTLVSALPTTFAVAWAESLLRLGHAVPLAVMPRVYGCVALIQLLMLLVQVRLHAPLAPRIAPAPAEPGTAPQPAPFLARIPPHLGQQLLALQAEDHYLRVITASGSDLILMRMADALRELDAQPGLQVHRSWWVAHEAVSGVRRDGGKTMLVLSNGQQVPVSRTYLPAVRSAPFAAAAQGMLTSS
ncbi:MAG: LytTR family DNA-binding domain-containing protein [Ramlibacter sp.]